MKACAAWHHRAGLGGRNESHSWFGTEVSDVSIHQMCRSNFLTSAEGALAVGSGARAFKTKRRKEVAHGSRVPTGRAGSSNVEEKAFFIVPRMHTKMRSRNVTNTHALLMCFAINLLPAQLFHDAHCAMRSLMWHKDQKSVCALVLAIVSKAQT